MRALKAGVKAGKLLLDGQTDRLDGVEFGVALVDDDLDDSEQGKPRAAIRAGEAEFDARQAVSEGEPWSRPRAVR